MKPCAHHQPHNIGYIAFFDWAERKAKSGAEQSQCGECKYWFFPEEMGESEVED